MVVLSLVAITFCAVPSIESFVLSSFIPLASVITVAPVKSAISSSMALRFSPNSGALRASTLITPRSLLTTSVANASPSTSSAIMTMSFFPVLASSFKSGTISAIAEIFLSVMRIAGLESSAVCRSALVIIYGEINPLSKFIPSTISLESPSVWDCSVVTTPSLPTASMTLAIISPISRDSAAIIATWAISSWEEILLEFFLSASITSSLAASIPRRIPTGLMPVSTNFKPSRTSACIITVEVVVPSPATSFVFSATCLISSAPRFSNLSLSSISLAIVTPSLVIVGPP